jgi:hypothetical protein
MSIRFTHLITILAMSVAAIGATSNVMAQTYSPKSEDASLDTVPEIFDGAFFRNSDEIFDMHTIRRQANTIFGWYSFPEGSFPENEIKRDAKLLHILHKDYMDQQMTSDTFIRTPDLANPFSSSLRQTPTYASSGQSVMGSELIYEKLPLR